jgi:hypothetical protein
MVQGVYGAGCVWCRVCMMQGVYGAGCVWCRVCMVQGVYGAWCLVLCARSMKYCV